MRLAVSLSFSPRTNDEVRERGAKPMVLGFGAGLSAASFCAPSFSSRSAWRGEVSLLC